MPVLENARYEVFAQARAKGASQEDAYEDAGFVPGGGHASRLAARKEVAERIAELRSQQADLAGARMQAVIAELLRMARASAELETAAGVKEARLTLLEACRLTGDLERARANERPKHLY